MYCRNCGKEIDNNLVQCPYCNTPVNQNQKVVEDSGSMWWGVLGCCVPIVGLVLYIVWKDTKPQSGKKAGIGALIGFVLGTILPIAFYMIIYGIITFLIGLSIAKILEGVSVFLSDNVYLLCCMVWSFLRYIVFDGFFIMILVVLFLNRTKQYLYQ